MSRAARIVAVVALLVATPACATAEPSASSGPRASSPESTDGEVTPAWQLRDEAPFARLEMAVAAHDGRIWLAGGLSPLGEALAEVEVYDPASGEWTTGPSLPTSVHHAALVSDGERLVLLGGYLGSSFSSPSELVLVLADGDDTWREGPALPAARGAGAAAFDGTRVVYAGGVGPAGVAADIFALEDGEWRTLGTMGAPREHLAAASDGAGTVWLLGGRVGGLDSNVATVETVAADDAVAESDPLPTPRGGVAAFFDDELGACLTGGEAPNGAITAVECVDTTGMVTVVSSTNMPHHGHGAAVVGGRAYVLLGGPQPGLSAEATVESLDLDP